MLLNLYYHHEYRPAPYIAPRMAPRKLTGPRRPREDDEAGLMLHLI